MTIPKVEVITLAGEEIEETEKGGTIETANEISGGEYQIAKGDSLWEISVRAYGDGYRWMEIAKANSLESPGLIHPGNTLTIPR